MRRPANREKILERIARWRHDLPDLALRSTFIVGFPKETEKDFQELLGWLEEAQLDRVGCFKYEPVKGALANEIEDIVPEEVKDERWHRFMEWQRRISVKRMISKVGRTIEVIIDDVDDRGAMGRSHWDAPEIDGRVFLNGDTKLALGDIIEARVKDADDYDRWAIRTTGG